MQQSPIKLGLLAVIILEAISVFFLLKIYNNFVSSPDNYYKNILTKRKEREVKMLKEIR